ncbi:MAG: ATP-binding protein [Pseudomonadota bacterium]
MAQTSSRTSAAPWRASQAALLLGAALIATVLVGVAWIGWFDYRSNVDGERSRQELLARVLEDQATRTFDSTGLALGALAARLESLPRWDEAHAGPALRETLAGLPFLRDVALVDRQGHVMSAAQPTQGPAPDLGFLGAWPEPGHQRIGSYAPGRTLADAARHGSPRASPPGVGFIPVLVGVAAPGGGGALLIGLVNPDSIANYQTQTVEGTDSVAALASYGGEVLTATEGAGLRAGAGLSGHELFKRRLPEREHDSFVGRGLAEDDRIVAFRASRRHPIVLVVEQPVSTVRSKWWRGIGAVGAVFAITVALLCTMTFLAWRGLASRERARALLDEAQQAVARREHELSVTVSSIQEVIFRTDEVGVITFVNARWPVAAGEEPSAAIGERFVDLVVSEHRRLAKSLFKHDGPEGLRSVQVAIKRSGGSAPSRLFDVAVVPLVERARIVGFVGSAVDVTDRVDAQQRLRAQLALTELLFEVSPLPLSLRDVHGRYLSVNQAWEEFTGRKRQHVLGLKVAPHLTRDEHDLHSTRDAELRASASGRLSYEASVVHADGSRRDAVFIKVLVPDQAGGSAGILTVSMDVTEFRAAERATREARDAAEEASRAKSEFIANISHELRTPLQSILGFSELGAVRGREQPKLQGMFQEINGAGKRMLALVNDLLDVAKIESSVGTFHLERADLRPLVREVVKELSPLIAERGLLLDLDLSDAPLTAKADPLRFQQVIRNVLANAIRFSPHKGRLEVRGDITPEGEIHLSFSDEGPGIPASEIDHIFDAFVQSSTTKDGSGGTGLGLTISRKILEVHGGRISAENKPAGGAVFHVHLPLRSPQETRPAPL